MNFLSWYRRYPFSHFFILQKSEHRHCENTGKLAAVELDIPSTRQQHVLTSRQGEKWLTRHALLSCPSRYKIVQVYLRIFRSSSNLFASDCFYLVNTTLHNLFSHVRETISVLCIKRRFSFASIPIAARTNTNAAEDIATTLPLCAQQKLPKTSLSIK